MRVLPATTAILVLLGAAPAASYQRPGRTLVASTDAAHQPGNDIAVYPSISGDGRAVAFASYASDLVPGDGNEDADAFVKDLVTGSIERVSLDEHGEEVRGGGPKLTSLSHDGRVVGFDSAAPLVAADANDDVDVYVRDLEQGTLEMATVNSAEVPANDGSGLHALSGDGRFIVFESPATNLVPGDTNGQADIFVRDRAEGTTTRVSISSSGVQANHRSHSPYLSRNGRFVVFASYASNLVAGDVNGYQDVFVHDRETGITERVSETYDGAQADDYSSYGVISDDGRYAVFGSWATNMVPADTGGIYDLFVRDRAAGTTERLSVSGVGAQAGAASDEPAISSDGRFVAFLSGAANLVSGDTNGSVDVFVRDLRTGATERVSVADDGSQVYGSAGWRPAISADGGAVAFVSAASGLGAEGEQAYVRVRGAAVDIPRLEVPAQKDPVVVLGEVVHSGTTLVQAGDPRGDGGEATLGADLTGASLRYQAEDERILVRWEVASLPGAAAARGLPGVTYGASLEADGVRYEVRASRVGATAVLPGTPSFTLHRCEPACVQVATLSGSIGTGGGYVAAGVPLWSLGAEDGSPFTNIRAFAGVGEAALGAPAPSDEVMLGAATIPVRTIAIGTGGPDDDEGDIVFQPVPAFGQGRFEVETSIPEGSTRLWARTCLGSACAIRSVPLDT